MSRLERDLEIMREELAAEQSAGRVNAGTIEELTKTITEQARHIEDLKAEYQSSWEIGHKLLAARATIDQQNKTIREMGIKSGEWKRLLVEWVETSRWIAPESSDRGWHVLRMLHDKTEQALACPGLAQAQEPSSP